MSPVLRLSCPTSHSNKAWLIRARVPLFFPSRNGGPTYKLCPGGHVGERSAFPSGRPSSRQLPFESLIAPRGKADDSARFFVEVAIIPQLGDTFAKYGGRHLLLGNVQILRGVALVHPGQ